MKVKLDRILLSRAFITLVYRLNRIYSATLRLEIENEAPWRDHLDRGGRVIICAWHQQFFSAVRHFQVYRRYRPALMISRSKDGTLIAGVARLTGWRPVRGSSSRGGKAALKKMIAHLKRFGLAGHLVDGPRGPAGVVKPGVIRMAQAADAVIVPASVTAESYWKFNSWDRFIVPKPFSRVKLRFETPLRLEDNLDSEGFERERRRLEAIMRPNLIP